MSASFFVNMEQQREENGQGGQSQRPQAAAAPSAPTLAASSAAAGLVVSDPLQSSKRAFAQVEEACERMDSHDELSGGHTNPQCDGRD
jgi:hypothetical protein